MSGVDSIAGAHIHNIYIYIYSPALAAKLFGKQNVIFYIINIQVKQAIFEETEPKENAPSSSLLTSYKHKQESSASSRQTLCFFVGQLLRNSIIITIFILSLEIDKTYTSDRSSKLRDILKRESLVLINVESSSPNRNLRSIRRLN